MCEGGSRESSQEIVVGVQHVFVCVSLRGILKTVTWAWWYYGCGGPVRARQGVGLSSGVDGGAI